MKKTLVINMILLSVLGCKDQITEKNAVKQNISEPVRTETTTNRGVEKFQKFEQSTYGRTDLKEKMENHQKELTSLSKNGIFKAISSRLFQDLSSKDQHYFSANPQYEVLSVASGTLTSAAENDRVFTVFDKSESIITILVYQGEKDQYRELYRTVKVENGLEDAGCNYGTFGTLDYQMGEEIIGQKEFLEKNVGQFFEAKPLIMKSLKGDENFAPEEGCFSKGMNAAEKVRFLAIPTSQIYSNWECLIYESASDSFLIFYGQAFAD